MESNSRLFARDTTDEQKDSSSNKKCYRDDKNATQPLRFAYLMLS